MKTVLMLLVLLVASFFVGYKSGQLDKTHELGVLIGAMEQQERQLNADYEKAVKQSQDTQKKIDELKTNQEKKDEQAQQAINLLSNELSRTAIRVRANSQSLACDSAGATSNSDNKIGEGNTPSAHWLLPKSNSKRLSAAIAEIETLSAAYASCRAVLFGLPSKQS